MAVPGRTRKGPCVASWLLRMIVPRCWVRRSGVGSGAAGQARPEEERGRRVGRRLLRGHARHAGAPVLLRRGVVTGGGPLAHAAAPLAHHRSRRGPGRAPTARPMGRRDVPVGAALPRRGQPGPAAVLPVQPELLHIRRTGTPSARCPPRRTADPGAPAALPSRRGPPPRLPGPGTAAPSLRDTRQGPGDNHICPGPAAVALTTPPSGSTAC